MDRRWKRTTRPPKDGGGGAGDERGAALVLVLWFTLLIGLVAAAVAGTGQSNARIAINQLQAAQAEALAEGGLEIAMAALRRTRTDDPWPIDGTPREVSLEPGRLVIEILAEDEKLNLNSAGEEALESIFTSLGRTAEEAQAMAAAMVAARGEMRLSYALGSGGRQPASRSGGFLVLGDIQGATGITDAEYRRLRDRVSLFSPIARRTGRRPMMAPQELAETPPGMQPQSRSRIYGITVRAEHHAGARAEIYAVVRRAARSRTGFEVLHWE